MPLSRVSSWRDEILPILSVSCTLSMMRMREAVATESFVRPVGPAQTLPGGLRVEGFSLTIQDVDRLIHCLRQTLRSMQTDECAQRPAVEFAA